MAEPTTAAATSLALQTAAIPVLAIFGIPLGLRPDLLLAGFFGAVAAMTLLNSVPGSGDTFRDLLATSMRRIGVGIGSAVTAGYMVPLFVSMTDMKMLGLDLATAFVLGAGAQKILGAAIDKWGSK